MEPGRLVSIVIPAWNGEGRIGAVVRSALSQKGPVEVVVVDDGSTDRTADEAETAGARVVRQENRGPASARNAGWRDAKGDRVFFTDSDCRPAPDWIERLAPLLDDETVGAVGGSYTAENGRMLLPSCIQEEIAIRHDRIPREARFLGSFNLGVRRKVLDRVGGFDETYRRASGEDNDLSYRIRKGGYRLLFVKEAVVAHRHPERLGKYLGEQARHGYWRMKLYREHPERAGGDDYSGPADFVEPPAALAFLLLLPFSFHPAVRLFAAGTLLLLAGTAAGPTIEMIRRRRNASYLYFFPVRIARSFARGIGMAAGIARFWFRPARREKTA